MATLLDVPRQSTPPAPTSPRHPSNDGRLRWPAQLAVAAVGVGLTLMVLEGSWWWAIVRVLIVGVVVSLVMRQIESGSRRSSGLAVAIVGLIGAAAGAAMTVSYSGGGWGVRVIGGLLALTGGLAAFLIGTVQAVRTVSGWWRVLAVAVAVLVAYTVAFPVTMSVYATNVGRPALGPDTPADHGFSYVDASFVTSDAVTLSGWYIPSRTGAAVVVLHGASSTRSAVLDEAVVLARHGYGVLLYDARGMGRSGGRAMDFGWYGDRDLAAAVGYLEHRPDVDATRIAALGESMGGEEAIGAMAGDPRVRAVVAEGATNRVLGDWDWLSDSYGLRGYLQRGVFWLTYTLTDALTAAHPPLTLRAAVARAAPRPVLLIAAGNEADEANADRDIQQASPNTVQLWIVPGANHIGGLSTAPTEWEQRVTAFLDQTLTRNP